MYLNSVDTGAPSRIRSTTIVDVCGSGLVKLTFAGCLRRFPGTRRHGRPAGPACGSPIRPWPQVGVYFGTALSLVTSLYLKRKA